VDESRPTGETDLMWPAPERVLDPVCGVELAPALAGLPVLFGGLRYWFCSWECRMAFKRAPEAHRDARPGAGSPAGPAPTHRRGPFVVRAGPSVSTDGAAGGQERASASDAGATESGD
jgi:YHS domain-containing protein